MDHQLTLEGKQKNQKPLLLHLGNGMRESQGQEAVGNTVGGLNKEEKNTRTGEDQSHIPSSIRERYRKI